MSGSRVNRERDRGDECDVFTLLCRGFRYAVFVLASAEVL
jgi:hypothetical protein